MRRLRSLLWSSVFWFNSEDNCVWYNNICLVMATEHTDSVYVLCDRNGSECVRNYSIQLVRGWPQWAISLCSILPASTTVTTTCFFWSTDFIWLCTRNRYFWLSEMTRFTSFVPSTTHFIWLSSFIFKICASSNTIEYAVWTSGVAKNPGAVNILPWSVFDVHVRKIQKIKV